MAGTAQFHYLQKYHYTNYSFEFQDNYDYETDDGGGDGFDSVIVRIALILSNIPWESALEDVSSSKFNEISRNLR